MRSQIFNIFIFKFYLGLLFCLDIEISAGTLVKKETFCPGTGPEFHPKMFFQKLFVSSVFLARSEFAIIFQCDLTLNSDQNTMVKKKLPSSLLLGEKKVKDLFGGRKSLFLAMYISTHIRL